MYPAYYYPWPAAHRRNPHVHYASDVRPEGKYTTRQPFSQFNYSGTEQAQQDPSKPDPLYTPRHTRQMLPGRPALRHLAPPPVRPLRTVPLPSDTPAPSAYAYATPYVHERAPTASAPQQAALCSPPPLAPNAHNIPAANPAPAAPPGRPVYGTPPIWSWKSDRWEGDFTHQAQAPSVPTSSSAPPMVQTTDPPATATQTRPPPPVHQRLQSTQYQAPSSAQPVQIPQSAPALAQTSSVSAHNPSYVAQAPTLAAGAAQEEPDSPTTSVDYNPPSIAVESAHRASASQQAIGSPPVTSCEAPPTNLNAGVGATGDSTPSRDGHLILNGSASFNHTSGIYVMPTLLSPWDAIRSLEVTVPVSVNDLQKILRRAQNLESASFSQILPKTRPLRHGVRLELPHLHSLTIQNIQGYVRGVLKQLDAAKLVLMHVSYASGSAYYLWGDEQDYYSLVHRIRNLAQGSSGRLTVSSNDDWYRDNRAGQLQTLLEAAVGEGWHITIR